MLKFNRKTEYGLIALRYIASRGAMGRVSAREISDAYQIPYPVLSKVLQQLHGAGIISSVQGTKGGYTLHRPLEQVSLAQLVEIFEGPLGVTDCIGQSLHAGGSCSLTHVCNVKSVFHGINQRIAEMLRNISLKEMTP
jgi:Rrf2 family protein